MGLALAGIVALDGALGLEEIALAQTAALGPLPRWNLLTQPLGGGISLICVMAWSGMPPFEPGPLEEQLAGGHRIGYGGFRLALLEAGGYARRLAGAALWVTLYAGGWHLPYATFADAGGWGAGLAQAGAFTFKVMLTVGFFCWARWSAPGLRYGQAMRLVWKVLLPLAVLNLIWAGMSASLFFRNP
jgi:NADH-quinone oxidoreductase subunit H